MEVFNMNFIKKLGLRVLCIQSILQTILISPTFASKIFDDQIVSFKQPGTYCYFTYIEKPESALEAAFKDFFSSAACAGRCGAIDVVVNMEKNTIYWDWEHCGEATRTYVEVAVPKIIPEVNQGPPQCQNK